MGGFSKIIGEKNVFIDPYVQVSFCGQQVSLLGLGYSSFSVSTCCGTWQSHGDRLEEPRSKHRE